MNPENHEATAEDQDDTTDTNGYNDYTADEFLSPDWEIPNPGERILHYSFDVMESLLDEDSNRDSELFQTFPPRLAEFSNNLFFAVSGTHKTRVILNRSRRSLCKVTVDIVTRIATTTIAEMVQDHIWNTHSPVSCPVTDADSEVSADADSEVSADADADAVSPGDMPQRAPSGIDDRSPATVEEDTNGELGLTDAEVAFRLTKLRNAMKKSDVVNNESAADEQSPSPLEPAVEVIEGARAVPHSPGTTNPSSPDFLMELIEEARTDPHPTEKVEATPDDIVPPPAPRKRTPRPCVQLYVPPHLRGESTVTGQTMPRCGKSKAKGRPGKPIPRGVESPAAVKPGKTMPSLGVSPAAAKPGKTMPEKTMPRRGESTARSGQTMPRPGRCGYSVSRGTLSLDEATGNLSSATRGQPPEDASQQGERSARARRGDGRDSIAGRIYSRPGHGICADSNNNF